MLVLNPKKGTGPIGSFCGQKPQTHQTGSVLNQGWGGKTRGQSKKKGESTTEVGREMQRGTFSSKNPGGKKTPRFEKKNRLGVAGKRRFNKGN